jgi:hypothetical protein
MQRVLGQEWGRNDRPEADGPSPHMHEEAMCRRHKGHAASRDADGREPHDSMSLASNLMQCPACDGASAGAPAYGQTNCKRTKPTTTAGKAGNAGRVHRVALSAVQGRGLRLVQPLCATARANGVKGGRLKKQAG